MKYFLLTLALAVFSSSMFSQPLEWVKPFSSTGEVVIADAISNNSGEIFCIGYFETGVQLELETGEEAVVSPSNKGMLLAKCDNAGNFEWLTHFDGTSEIRPQDMAVDNEGNLFIIGYFNGTVDFDPGPGEHEVTSLYASLNGFLLKLNEAGEFMWVVAAQSTAGMILGDCEVDSENNVVLGGFFRGDATFDLTDGEETFESSGNFDGILMKLDNNGNELWSEQMGSIGDDRIYTIEIGNEDEIYLGAAFEETVDLGFGGEELNFTSLSPTGKTAFLAKLESDGANAVWVKLFEGTGSGGLTALTLAEDGSIYCGGVFLGDLDFDPGPDTYDLSSASIFSTEMYVAKLSDAGDFEWASCTASEFGSDFVYDIVIPPGQNNVLIFGEYDNDTDFNPGAPVNFVPAQGADPFLWSLNEEDGSFDFAYNWGGPYFDYGKAMIPLEEGFLTMGSFSGEVDFDLSDTENVLNSYISTSPDGYLAKYTYGYIGIEENDELTEIILYPNPTSNGFFVNMKGEFDVELFSINGSLVYSQHSCTAESRIEADLPEGDYLILITHKDRTYHKKMVVVK